QRPRQDRRVRHDSQIAEQHRPKEAHQVRARGQPFHELADGRMNRLGFVACVDKDIGIDSDAHEERSITALIPSLSSRSTHGRPNRYRRPVRVATWNVNSVKQQMPRLLPWLDQRQPDVVCLQKTKLADDAFAELLGDELDRRGYMTAHHGEAQWNGVAILSRAGLDDVVVGIAGAPGFPHPEARAVSATCGGVRLHSVYVPNGRV